MMTETSVVTSIAVVMGKRDAQEVVELVTAVTGHAAGVKDTAVVLQSVHIVSDGRRVTASATDRYTLAEAWFVAERHEPFQVTVEAKALAVALKAVKGGPVLRFMPSDDGTVTVDDMSTRVTVPAVSGAYPDLAKLWPEVKPEHLPYSAFGVTPATLAKLGKLPKSAGVLKFQLGAGNRKPIVVTCGMPIRLLAMPSRLADDDI